MTTEVFHLVRALSALAGRALDNLDLGSWKRQNLESRAKSARWIRTLTLILSLIGRGEETPDRIYVEFSRRQKG